MGLAWLHDELGRRLRHSGLSFVRYAQQTSATDAEWARMVGDMQRKLKRIVQVRPAGLDHRQRSAAQRSAGVPCLVLTLRSLAVAVAVAEPRGHPRRSSAVPIGVSR